MENFQQQQQRGIPVYGRRSRQSRHSLGSLDDTSVVHTHHHDACTKRRSATPDPRDTIYYSVTSDVDSDVCVDVALTVENDQHRGCVLRAQVDNNNKEDIVIRKLMPSSCSINSSDVNAVQDEHQIVS